MRRRGFLTRLGRSALGASLIPAGLWEALGCAAPEPATEARAGSAGDAISGSATPRSDFHAFAWVHGNGQRTPAQWSRRFAGLREMGISGVLVSGGDTAVLSDAAHAEGLEFHRWMWILNRNNDAFAQREHPEWFTVNRNGDSTLDTPPYVPYYKWVCPTREPVRAHIRAEIDAVAADPRVDGVHLDYIRHSDVILPVGLWAKYDLIQDREYPEFDYCYCDVCRPAFERLTGVDPMTLADAPEHDAWRRFRWDSVTRLVSELAGVVHGHDKPISAAVFPTPKLARRLVRQAWDEWPVDVLYPMLYHSFYEQDIRWIGKGVAEGVAALSGSNTLLRAGLYLPDLDPAGMAEAVETARRSGAAGVSFFEMDGLSADHASSLRPLLAG